MTAVRITKSDKSNLARFGCALLPKGNLICIGWETQRAEQASSAAIDARIIPFTSQTGPLLVLAFEISPTKAFPRYCFFPFDLQNNEHRKYFSNILAAGKLNLCFLADSQEISRSYEISPAGRAGAADLYASLVSDFEKFPKDQYDFSTAVTEFEHTVRLSDNFGSSAPSITDIQGLATVASQKVQNVSEGERAESERIVAEFLRIFELAYGRHLGKELEGLPGSGQLAQLIDDFHSASIEDRDRFAYVLANAIAEDKSKHQNIKTLTVVLEGIVQLLDHQSKTTESDLGSQPEIQTTLREIVNRAQDAKGVSIGSLTNFLSLIGLPVGGRPGRSGKDYAKEYELRAEGKKWREVAEYRLQNDPETKQEFGSRCFAELEPQQQELLKHRVREGLRAYADRTQKPFPPRKPDQPH